MFRWIKRWLGHGAEESSSERVALSAPLSEEQAAYAAYLRQQRTQQHVASVPIVPLDEALSSHQSLEDDLPERRHKKQERRMGKERRKGEEDRRKKNVPVKQDRRKQLWDRRKQYGERRFNPDRRAMLRRKKMLEQIAQQALMINHNMLTLDAPTPIEGLLRDSSAHMPVVDTASSLAINNSNDTEIIKIMPELHTGKAILNPIGEVIAHTRVGIEDNSTMLDMACAEDRVVDCCHPSGKVQLGKAKETMTQTMIDCHQPHHKIIITTQGKMVLMINAATRGEIVICSEHPKHALSEVKNHPLPHVILDVQDIGKDIVIHDGQNFRLGQVELHVDLTQVVDFIRSDGSLMRISGPAGLVNFQRFLEKDE